MTKREIVERIAQGEDSRTQFKRGPIGVAKLAAEFAAFSNSSGGVIIFGVGDDGKVVGLGARDKKLLDSEISNTANDNVRPAVYPQTEYHTIRGKQVLCVMIAEGVSKPYADKSGNYWMKSGPDKRRITSREELQRILQKSHLLHADEVPVYGTGTKDIDLYHFGEFLERNYGISADDVLEPGKVDIPQMLRNLGFADEQNLTLAGLMLFGKNPQRYAPVNVVKCVSYVGNDVAGSKYRDSEDFRGTIRDMYKSTMQFILRNLRHEQAGQGFNSIGVPEVPEEALQELVANMFLHRDYFMSSPWRVMVFDNRVELISPGSLPNHLTVEMMKSGVSVARNPLIFTFATKEIPYRGIGSGIRRVMEIAPKVEFLSDSETNFFTVKIFRLKVDDAPVKSGDAPVNGADAPINSSDVPVKSGNAPVNGTDAPVKSGDAPVKGRAEPINDAELAKVKELIRSNPGISKKELSRSSGIAVWTIKRMLEVSLRGKIEFRGAPKNGGYYLKEQ
ncbi:MAG: putative DNA binding domain-containing protein [Kiritimatiellae bacterium]|nr:putative DNA binding domain-containing protein [Kiritimatiellia bacterium]